MINKLFLVFLALLLFACQTITTLQFDITYTDQFGNTQEQSFRWYSFSNGKLIGLLTNNKEITVYNCNINDVEKYIIGVR